MKRILDRTFRYVPSVETDIRKTFRREQKRLAEQQRKQEQADHEAKTKVVAKIGK